MACNRHPSVPAMTTLTFVLDTNIPRELAHREPPWYANLLQLRALGHEIALHDLVAGELTDQMQKFAAAGKLGSGPGKVDFVAMCDRLDRIISKRTPLWPGRDEIIALYPHGPDGDAEVSRSFRRKSVAQYTALTNVLRAGRYVQTEMEVDGERYRIGDPERFKEAGKVLQASRDSWLSIMRRCLSMRNTPPASVPAGGQPVPTFNQFTEDQIAQVAFHVLKREMPQIPDIDRRLHLAYRYFAWYEYMVMHPHPKVHLDPEHEHRQNDGLDADLPFALFWPCVVLTADKKFLNKIAMVDSPQRPMIMHPDDLG